MTVLERVHCFGGANRIRKMPDSLPGSNGRRQEGGGSIVGTRSGDELRLCARELEIELDLEELTRVV